MGRVYIMKVPIPIIWDIPEKEWGPIFKGGARKSIRVRPPPKKSNIVTPNAARLASPPAARQLADDANPNNLIRPSAKDTETGPLEIRWNDELMFIERLASEISQKRVPDIGTFAGWFIAFSRAYRGCNSVAWERINRVEVCKTYFSQWRIWALAKFLSQKRAPGRLLAATDIFMQIPKANGAAGYMTFMSFLHVLWIKERILRCFLPNEELWYGLDVFWSSAQLLGLPLMDLKEATKSGMPVESRASRVAACRLPPGDQRP